MNNRCKPIGRSATLLVAAMFAGALSAKEPASRGIRFDSPSVLDLADREKASALSRDVPVIAMDATESGQIVAATALSDDRATLSFSDDVFGCKPPSKRCSQSAEHKRIDASKGTATRQGATLNIAANAGAPVVFKDWKLAESKSADGDGETHWYLGTLPGSGYARVEVQFEHDAPGDFLINAANGKSAFVHNGSDVVALSPEGLSVLTYDNLNAPMSMRIASLGRDGPSIAVQCVGKADDRTQVEIRGWRDAKTVDLAIVSRDEAGQRAQTAAVRLQKIGSVWQIATGNPERLLALGFSCRD